jgi:hypothetical protein
MLQRRALMRATMGQARLAGDVPHAKASSKSWLFFVRCRRFVALSGESFVGAFGGALLRLNYFDTARMRTAWNCCNPAWSVLRSSAKLANTD